MKRMHGGAREGAGKPRMFADQKRIPYRIFLRSGDITAFEAVGGTKKLVAKWVSCYSMARGETDRLLAQAPIAGRLLNFLEGLGTPESEALAEELFGLIVNRDSDEIRIIEGEKVGDSWIV